MSFLRRFVRISPATRSFFTGNVQRSSNVQMYAPNNLEKKFLVWTGKYKKIEDIPPMISAEVMERSRNRIRIRLANIMMVATVFGCIVMVISGKAAQGRGESMTKRNLEWHKQFNEESTTSTPKEN
ncbi:hypothetical protein ACFFRR_011920 [Megaselia abdita]